VKTGYRWAGYAWALYRLLSGSVFLTLLWQAAKFAVRRFRAAEQRRRMGAKKRTG
jgi:hypothetical protein